MILGLLIISAGLIQTGVVDLVGRTIFDLAGRNPAVFLPVIMVAAAAFSAFMSNTAATAFFVPLVIGYAARIGESPSKFLLPLAFASILTSSVTLISTSTNWLVSDLLTPYQQAPMACFEMARSAFRSPCRHPLCVGDRRALIPQRDDQKAEEKIGDRKYQADVLVLGGRPLIGKSSRRRNSPRRGAEGLKLIRDEETIRARRSWPISSWHAATTVHRRAARRSAQDQDIEGVDFKADVQLADRTTKREATIVECCCFRARR